MSDHGQVNNRLGIDFSSPTQTYTPTRAPRHFHVVLLPNVILAFPSRMLWPSGFWPAF